MGRREGDEVFDSFEEFLDWIGRTLLDEHDAEVAEEAEAKKKAKSKGKRGRVPRRWRRCMSSRSEASNFASLAITADGRWAVTACSSKTSPAGLVVPKLLPGEAMPPADELASNGALLLWDIPGRRFVRDLSDGGKLSRQRKDGSVVDGWMPVNAAAAVFSCDASRVAAASGYQLFIVETATGRFLRIGSESVYNSTVLASPTGDHSPRLRFGRNSAGQRGRHRRRREASRRWCGGEAHRGYAMGAGFSHDGRLAYTSGKDCSLVAWKIPSGKHVADLPRQQLADLRNCRLTQRRLPGPGRLEQPYGAALGPLRRAR